MNRTTELSRSNNNKKQSSFTSTGNSRGDFENWGRNLLTEPPKRNSVKTISFGKKNESISGGTLNFASHDEIMNNITRTSKSNS
jgi:hypothetical protein